MRPKMFRQPRARCLKIFLFLTGSSVILLWNYYNPQGLSGMSSKQNTSGDQPIGALPVPVPKKHQFAPLPVESIPVIAKPQEKQESGQKLALKAPKKASKKKPPKSVQKAIPKPTTKPAQRKLTGLVAGNGSFYMDEKPITILSGSFHYFRTLPQQWSNRLAKMRSAGLNTVTTYIPWNLHEPQKGKFEFSGLFNIAEFIKTVQKHKLYLIVRPGPYICAEWEFGGFPYWMLRDPNMKFRTSSYKPYLNAVDSYFNHLLPIFVPFMYKNGGPIVAFQIENEFGSWGPDPQYMKFLHKLFIKHGLNKELLLTSDGAPHLKKGKIDGVFTTVNFNGDPEKKLQTLKTIQPDKPRMVMEFWPGWFDRWKEKHHVMSTAVLKEKITAVLSLNASINFYMFVGGTHFDFWNGASNISGRYGAIVTSYDYDAPVSESGDVGDKYKMLRELFTKFKLVPADLPPIPENSVKQAYESVTISEFLQLPDMLKLVPKPFQNYKYPRSMERIYINNGNGQGYGWILYRTKIKKPKGPVVLSGLIHDRAHVHYNGQLVDIFEYKKGNYTLKIPANGGKAEGNMLDIFVENMGRVNWEKAINIQHKGLLGNVTIQNTPTASWDHIPFEFGADFKANLSASADWKSFKKFKTQIRPTLYRGFLNIKTEPKDTFLNMSKWTRGIVLVNKFNIGRYWRNGPQRTLYVPAPLLEKGRNELIVFELHKADKQLSFTNKALLTLESQQVKQSKN